MTSSLRLDVLIGAGVVALAIFGWPAAAQHPQRACNVADPDLAAAETGVVPAYPVFEYKNVPYDLETFGIAEADKSFTSPPYRICRRYEFVNKSNHVIESLRWPDIALPSIKEVRPGERYRIPRDSVSNSTDVGAALTELYAWENVKAIGRTAFPVRIQKVDLEHGPNSIYELSPKAFAGVLDSITGKDLSFDAQRSFYRPSEPVAYPALQAGVVVGDVSFLILSSATAYPGDSYVQSLVEVQTSWTRQGTAKVSAPGLVSLEAVTFERNQRVQDRVQVFSADLPERGEGTVTFTNGKFDLGYPMPDDAKQPVLFVVDQPVTLSIGSWSACVMVPVYGPVPISLGDTYCDATP